MAKLGRVKKKDKVSYACRQSHGHIIKKEEDHHALKGAEFDVHTFLGSA